MISVIPIRNNPGRFSLVHFDHEQPNRNVVGHHRAKTILHFLSPMVHPSETKEAFLSKSCDVLCLEVFVVEILVQLDYHPQF